MAAISAKYNFSKIQNGEVYRYVDMENAISLLIVKSGWKDKYDCIIESGEYGSVDVWLYTAQQIQKYYGITTFLRKEKLIKINKNSE
jgi:hypothetical protein